MDKRDNCDYAKKRGYLGRMDKILHIFYITVS